MKEYPNETSHHFCKPINEANMIGHMRIKSEWGEELIYRWVVVHEIQEIHSP
jgi:hypothetical protein